MAKGKNSVLYEQLITLFQCVILMMKSRNWSVRDMRVDFRKVTIDDKEGVITISLELKKDNLIKR